MKRNLGFEVLLAAGIAALLAGCWGSDKSTSLEVSSGGNVLAGAAAVGIDKCHNCHADTAVNGQGIFDAWAGSRHGNLDNSFDLFDNTNGAGASWYHALRPGYDPAEVEECGPCHDPNGDGQNLGKYTGAGSSTDPNYAWAGTTRFVVGCEACHGGGSLHFGVGPIGGPTLGIYAVAATTDQSSQYNTCRSCHGDTFHTDRSYRLIGDTHFDNANREVGSDLQGYVIRTTASTSCTDCHNPHAASMTVNGNKESPYLQWKGSGHGDFAGEGWKHYQWTDGTGGVVVSSDRRSCQRCHTTTGAVNFLNDPAKYDPSKNVFAWLKSPATDNRAEMLYCYGCHTNNNGGLRDPGAITASYTGVSPEPVFPDVAGSNICLACHTGRESGDSIKAKTTSDFSNLSFVNSHYLTAGATLFAASGYTYDNLSYANVSYFAHDLIGTSDAPGTGGNGPCVGCHMTSTLNPVDYTQGKHKFLNVGLDNTGSGEIITTPVCGVCHTFLPMAIADLDAAEEEALAGLSVLDNVLRARGYFFANSHPYFFKSADNTSSSNAVKNWSKRYDGSAGDNSVGMNNMGAAFNYNLFAHDPGFFVHNFVYTKRLIYDSIDWLDDNQLNASTQSYVNASITDPATKATALTYFGTAGRP